MEGNSRTRSTEIIAHLRTSNAAEARMLVELVGIMVEESRTSLVRAMPEEFQKLQGATQMLEKLYKNLTTTPPTQERSS